MPKNLSGVLSEKKRPAEPAFLFSATPRYLIRAYISAVISKNLNETQLIKSKNLCPNNLIISQKRPGGAGSARRGLAKISGTLRRRRQPINVITCAVTNAVWRPKRENRMIPDNNNRYPVSSNPYGRLRRRTPPAFCQTAPRAARPAGFYRTNYYILDNF